MKAGGSKGAKVYAMPEDYIRRQRWTAFLIKNEPVGFRLACWYIGPETGRLLGVYSPKTDSAAVYTKAWNINKDYTLEYDEEGDDEDYDTAGIFIYMSKSPETYCTEYMGYFIGMEPCPPAEPKCRVIPFPAKGEPPKEMPEKAAEI